jgi:signal transduction histidine kinase
MPTLAAIDPVLLDRGLALGLLVIGLAQAWPGYVPIVERWDRVDWVAYLFPAAIAVIVPLTVLIRRPRPVLAFFASIALAQFEVPSLATPSIAIALCTYALGRWETPRRDSLIALGTGIALFVTVTAVRQGLDWWFIVVALTLAGLWWIGDVVRDRDDRTVAFQLQAARHEAERRRDAALAADAERARIARELHDVIAHNVSVMVVQAAAANRVLNDDPAAAGASLSIIETTGREALTEMRRLLGVLRQGEASLSDPAAVAGTPATAHRRDARRRPAGRPHDRGRCGAPATGRRPVGLPRRPGGADQRPAPRRTKPDRGGDPLRSDRARDRSVRCGPRRRGAGDGGDRVT